MHELPTRGLMAVKSLRRALALLALHESQSYAAVARSQQVCYATVLDRVKQFAVCGLEILTDQPRSDWLLTADYQLPGISKTHGPGRQSC